MDILYVNAEEILQKTSLFKIGRTQEKTHSSWSVIWVNIPQERILFAENLEVKNQD